MVYIFIYLDDTVSIIGFMILLKKVEECFIQFSLQITSQNFFMQNLTPIYGKKFDNVNIRLSSMCKNSL